ncbi:conserved hypothetical protein [Desulfosarcina cetonica]|uniref:esterase/lipase family protein n=1 Tax=Desulfosarcina cetonica TaxID=90730 RepID=UPI000A44E7AC|nr:alpha/beta fold hydrolase [Desulfosarcina cetonica]VTR67537.1 conserved hypothetical protein [Desulfosarcina cetonica]
MSFFQKWKAGPPVPRWACAIVSAMAILSGEAAGDSTAVPADRIPARVILLHGLGRTSRSMAPMAAYLAAHGFTVINHAYPSTRQPVETLSQGLVPTIAGCLKADPRAPIHVVTHSLGGIVLRHYLQTHDLPTGSRVVMLSPPNQGSEIADWLQGFWPYRRIMGPAGQQLGTAADALPRRLGPIALPVGIITGDRSLEPWFSVRIPGPDDGKVAVARACLAGMTDFLVVHRSHGFIMRAPEVLQQTLFFLVHGAFRQGGAASTLNPN